MNCVCNACLIHVLVMVVGSLEHTSNSDALRSKNKGIFMEFDVEICDCKYI